MSYVSAKSWQRLLRVC